MVRLRCVIEHITYRNEENGWAVMKVRVKGVDNLVTLTGSLTDQGHVFALPDQLLEEATSLLEADRVRVEKALEEMTGCGDVITDGDAPYPCRRYRSASECRRRKCTARHN